MLEADRLLLTPWTPAEREYINGPAETRHLKLARAVLFPSTGETLGFVYQETGARSWWRRRLGRPVLGVHETMDESLLFTLHRTCGLVLGWEIRDADGRNVGAYARSVVRDPFGRGVALLAWPGEPTGRFLTPNGDELGTFWRSDEGTHLAFMEQICENPFYKMTLLGAVLADEGVETAPVIGSRGHS